MPTKPSSSDIIIEIIQGIQYISSQVEKASINTDPGEIQWGVHL